MAKSRWDKTEKKVAAKANANLKKATKETASDTTEKVKTKICRINEHYHKMAKGKAGSKGITLQGYLEGLIANDK